MTFWNEVPKSRKKSLAEVRLSVIWNEFSDLYNSSGFIINISKQLALAGLWR